MAKKSDNSYRYETVVYPAETVRSTPVPEDKPTETKRATNRGQIQRAVSKSADPLAILKGVTAAHTPAEITRMLKDAHSIALAQNSWEGLLAIVKLELEYSIGKPVQRSIHAEITPETFARWFSDEEIQVSGGNSEAVVREEVMRRQD